MGAMGAMGARRPVTGVVLVGVVVGVALADAPSAANLSGDPGRYTGKLEDRKKVCMIQDTVQPRDGIEYAYNGKTYYLCCMGCVAGFQKHPARYSQATDPVNWALVDKADARIYAGEGRPYFFRSDETAAAFAREPEKFLRQTAQPEMWSEKP